MADPKGALRNNNAFNGVDLGSLLAGESDARALLSDEQAIVTVDENRNIHYGRFTLSPVGVELPENTTQEEYAALGHVLLQLQSSTQWLIGDWLAFGEDREWGKTYADVAQHFGYEIETLYTYASVCRAVQTSMRVEVLSFAHHRAVVSLPLEQQREWLQKAIDHKWSSKQLRAEMRAALSAPQEQPSRIEMWHSTLDKLTRKAKTADERRALAEMLRRKADEIENA